MVPSHGPVYAWHKMQLILYVTNEHQLFSWITVTHIWRRLLCLNCLTLKLAQADGPEQIVRLT